MLCGQQLLGVEAFWYVPDGAADGGEKHVGAAGVCGAVACGGGGTACTAGDDMVGRVLAGPDD